MDQDKILFCTTQIEHSKDRSVLKKEHFRRGITYATIGAYNMAANDLKMVL